MSELGFVAPRLVRRGYDTRQVDLFMRRVAETLSGNALAPVTARDLVTARFRRVMPLTRGYACPEVDAYLFDVAPSVIRANGARSAVPAPAGRTRPGVVPEQRDHRSWLGRLVNRPN